jgi:hypothetical protein
MHYAVNEERDCFLLVAFRSFAPWGAYSHAARTKGLLCSPSAAGHVHRTNLAGVVFSHVEDGRRRGYIVSKTMREDARKMCVAANPFNIKPAWTSFRRFCRRRLLLLLKPPFSICTHCFENASVYRNHFIVAGPPDVHIAALLANRLLGF